MPAPNPTNSVAPDAAPCLSSVPRDGVAVPTTEGDNYRLFCGDCLEILPLLDRTEIAAVITDPPFGMNWDTDSRRFTGGKGAHYKNSNRIQDDDKPFDPSPWLDFPEVILWGSNHYAQRLPVGTTLVWAKKNEDKFGKFLSDAEIGWQKGGHGVYLYSHVWDGCARESECGEFYHPTQKPTALIEWQIRRLNLPEGTTILDPYAGSFTTGKAALRLGYKFIGIEIDPAHFQIGKTRLENFVAQQRLEL